MKSFRRPPAKGAAAGEGVLQPALPSRAPTQIGEGEPCDAPGALPAARGGTNGEDPASPSPRTVWLVYWRDENNAAVFTNREQAEKCAEALNVRANHPELFSFEDVPLDPPESEWDEWYL